MGHTVDVALLVGCALVLVAVLAVRLSSRTGVPALLVYISLGLVVERAGALVDASLKVGSTSSSELFGLALALLGVLTLVMGTAQFLRYRRRIATDDFVPSVVAHLVVVAGSLAFAGVFIVYVLFR